jgi:hypothetical protein
MSSETKDRNMIEGKTFVLCIRERTTMLKKCFVIFALLVFVSSAGMSKDAKSVVDDVAKAIGATDVNSIQDRKSVV